MSELHKTDVGHDYAFYLAPDELALLAATLAPTRGPHDVERAGRCTADAGQMFCQLLGAADPDVYHAVRAAYREHGDPTYYPSVRLGDPQYSPPDHARPGDAVLLAHPDPDGTPVGVLTDMPGRVTRVTRSQDDRGERVDSIEVEGALIHGRYDRLDDAGPFSGHFVYRMSGTGRHGDTIIVTRQGGN